MTSAEVRCETLPHHGCGGRKPVILSEAKDPRIQRAPCECRDPSSETPQDDGLSCLWVRHRSTFGCSNLRP